MPKPSEYLFVRAYCEWFRSREYWIKEQQEFAAQADAPLDTVRVDRPEGTIVRIGDIRNEHMAAELRAKVDRLKAKVGGE